MLAIYLQSVEFWVSVFGHGSLPKYFLHFTSLSTLRILLPDVKSSEFGTSDSHFLFCYFQFLTEDATTRLGAHDNTGAIREHPFFRGMDWEALQQKCKEPPLNPHEVSGTGSVFISCHKLL